VLNAEAAHRRSDRPLALASRDFAPARAVATRAVAAQPAAGSQAASDAILLERIACGDRAAMRLLFARYRVDAYRFILRIVKDPSAADDLTADVFLEVWRTAGRFEGRSSTRTWLLGIARLKALSLLRRPRHAQLDEEAAAEIADLACNPADALEHQDRRAIIRKCLARLSAKHREVIDLVYYHEQSVADVAEILGIPGGTVKTRMCYARRRLSAMLRAAGIDRTACDPSFS
jgi:RNA polymerase sigma-70 factor (ECF subfamily)